MVDGSWELADKSVIGASELSDDNDGKNDNLNWTLTESVRQRNNIFTASSLSSFLKWIQMWEAQKVTGMLIF